SAFHHSMNYRSVVLLGTATEVRDLEEKRAALHALVEHVMPGRAAEVRPPTDDELTGTLVLRLPISEASAKVRTGPPLDDEADYPLPVWAGELPLRLVPQAVCADPRLPEACPLPAYVREYQRPGAAAAGANGKSAHRSPTAAVTPSATPSACAEG